MRSVPELALNGPLGLQPCSSITSRGHQIVGLQIVLRDQKSKEGFKSQSIEILLIRTARWVVSQTRVLQRSNTRAIFHKVFIDIVSTCVIFVGRQNRPTLLQHSSPLSTDTKHSTVMYVCGGIFPTSPWYRMFSQCVLLCFLCACSFFKLPLCGFSSVHISYSS